MHGNIKINSFKNKKPYARKNKDRSSLKIKNRVHENVKTGPFKN